MRILIIRHGDPDYAHDCLTELGQRQAEAAAVRLMSEDIETVYSSSMGRAYETALAYVREASAQAGKDSAKEIEAIRQLDFMREIRYGQGEALYTTGNPWDEADKMATEDRELLDLNWHDEPFFRDNVATSEVDRIAEATDEWMLELGYRREGRYYRNIREDDQEHTVALFCHGGSGTAMLARILNLPFPYLCAIIRMRHTAITSIRMNNEPGSRIMPVLEFACDAEHLKQIK